MTNKREILEEQVKGYLSGVELPGDIKKLNLGQVTYLIDNLRMGGESDVSQCQVSLVWMHSYNWKDQPECGQYENYYPEQVLYLDALARLQEIHMKFEGTKV